MKQFMLLLAVVLFLSLAGNVFALTPPSISVTFSPSSTVAYPTSTTASCSRVAGDPSSTITLYRDGTSVSSGTSSPRSEIITLQTGIYNYTCMVSAAGNYSAGVSLDNYLMVTSINSCGAVISEPGTYTVTSDLSGTVDPCIWISASDVVLDLNAHTLYSGGFSFNGVYIEPTVFVKLSNITVRSGTIRNFPNSNILIHYADNVTIDNVDISGQIGSDYGIHIHQGNSLSVTHSQIHGNQLAGLWIGDCPPVGGQYYYIRENTFMNVQKDIDVSSGCLADSWVIKNTFGNVTVDPSCCTTKYVTVFPFIINQPTVTCVMPCGTYMVSSDRALTCVNCDRTDFVGNFWYGFSQDATYSGSSYNRWIRETYAYASGNTNNGLFLDSSTNSNWGCEVEGKKFDSGTNNTFVTACPASLYPGETSPLCQPGWICIDTHTMGYRLPDCTFFNDTVPCGSAKVCIDGACVAPITPISEVNVSWTAPSPYCNATEFSAGNIQFLLPFCTPFFFAIVIMLVFNGFLAYGVTRVGGTSEIGTIVFVVGALAFSLLYLYYGVFPSWVGVMFIIAEAALLVVLLQKIFGK